MSSPATKCTEKECKQLYNGIDKLKVSILAGLVFLLLSLPYTHALVAKFVSSLGFDMFAKNGCLSFAGITVMAIIYTIVTRLLML